MSVEKRPEVTGESLRKIVQKRQESKSAATAGASAKVSRLKEVSLFQDEEKKAFKPAKAAELRADRSVAKLSFRNVVSNTMTSPIPKKTPSASVPSKTAQSYIDRKGPERRFNTESNPTAEADPPVSKVPNKKGRNVPWRDLEENSTRLCDVRFIPRIDPSMVGKIIEHQTNCPRPRDQAQMQVQESRPLVQSGMQNRRPMMHMQMQNSNWTNFGHADVALKRILEWKNNEPPPVEGNMKINMVTRVFKNMHEYCNSFFPLLLHEMWNTVYDDYLWSKRSPPTITALVTQVGNGSLLNSVTFYGLCTGQEVGVVKDGFTNKTLVRIEVRTLQGTKALIKPTFALVTQCNVFKKSQQHRGRSYYDDVLRSFTSGSRIQGLSHAIEIRVEMKEVVGMDTKKAHDFDCDLQNGSQHQVIGVHRGSSKDEAFWPHFEPSHPKLLYR